MNGEEQLQNMLTEINEGRKLKEMQEKLESRIEEDNWKQKYLLLKEDFDVIFNTLMRLVGDGTELEIDLPSGQHVSIKGRYY